MSMKLIYYSKNILKNVIYGLFPHKVIAWKKTSQQAGSAINSYHHDVFRSYFGYIGIDDIERYVRDKVIVELGPGSILGTAFYSLVYGARQVFCVDRFPIADIESQKSYFSLLTQYVPDSLKERAERIVADFAEEQRKIRYCSDLSGRFQDMGAIDADLILSNAVMEHVYDLPALCAAMKKMSKKGTVMFHGIDMRSHKMHHRNALDFHDVPDAIWKAMTSHRGAPNRKRKKDYLALFQEYGFEVSKEIIIEKYPPAVIKEYVNTRGLTSEEKNDLEVAVIGFVCQAS